MGGYDGTDVDPMDVMEMQPFRKDSDEHIALLCAIAAGFWPCGCMLYKNGRNPAQWYTMENVSVSAFRGSANCDYVMKGADGEEWMMYSDSMRMGQHNSIMDSSLVSSNYALLFSNGLSLDRNKWEVRFDKWYAYADEKDSDRYAELLELRRLVMPAFKESIEGRDLALFPLELRDRMVAFVRGKPFGLRGIEAVQKGVEVEGT